MDATTFFLTYPQSEFTHEQVHEFLQSIKPVVWARVGLETHESGDPHCHAVVRFGARVKTRSNVRLFDLLGRHPNIQVPRKVRDVLEYCAKAGNYRDFGPVPSSASIYDTLLQEATRRNREEFDRVAMANRVSFQWALHIWAIATQATNDVVEPGAGHMCLQLQGLQLPQGSTAVIGPSGCGKSTWAKTVAPKPALWVSHMDDLCKFRAGHHQSIIFDDMDFKHMPRVAQIHITDQTDVRSLHVRYRTVTIPAGVTKIFTGNEKMFSDDEAINRRVHYINIISFAI